MYATAAILVLLVCTLDVCVAGNPNINTIKTETGEPMYSTPLSCSYQPLYMVSPYNNVRKTYTQIEDKKCCYLESSRHKCCLQKDSKDASESCRCDPSVSCSVTTTTSTTTTTTTTVPTTTTTTVPTTTTRTTLPTTTTRTTVPTTTRATVPTTTSTTTRPTTTSTTTRPTTTSTTTRPTTTSTTTVPTTTSTTTVPTTTSTTTVPTTTSTTTVPTTTSTTTVPTTTSTTTVPTTTTTKATTKTTTKATTKTTVKATTTTRPTTTTSTSTTTSTTTTTTTPSKALCKSTFRVLNGEKALNDCPNSGIFNITFSDGSISACNAVYSLATVNGAYKPTILTAGTCKDLIDALSTPEDPLFINIGAHKHQLLAPAFTTVSGPDNTAFIDVADSSVLDEVGACQENVRCPYNKDTMQGRVDMTKCTVYSWGNSNAEEYSQDGLNKVALTFNDGGCLDTDPSSPNNLCFKSTSGKNVICGSDTGAPVYCKALETLEEILMGVADLHTHCDETPNVTVLRHPA